MAKGDHSNDQARQKAVKEVRARTLDEVLAAMPAPRRAKIKARSRKLIAMAPIHPGEILREEFMGPIGIKAYNLAKYLHIGHAELERIVREEEGITADIALRLGKFFGTTPEFWMNLQAHYDSPRLDWCQNRIHDRRPTTKE